MNQWLLWLGLAAAVVWLVARHGAHLLEVVPFLLLLACPLMHLFGHGHGHGSHGAHGSDGAPRPVPPPNADTTTRHEPTSGGHTH